MRPARRPIPAADLKALLMLMDQWPNSWAGAAKDVAIGAAITVRMRSFVEHLHQRGLANTTLRRHANNLWLIGGEIIRMLHDRPALRKKTADALLIEILCDGEAPSVSHLSADEQRQLDATARKFVSFLVF